MKLLFLMGTDALGAVIMLLLLVGFGWVIFFLCKYLLTKIFSHFSRKRIVLLSVLFAIILVPVIVVTLFWVVVWNLQG